MQEFFYEIKNPVGIHVRPAGLLVKEALKYDCSVQIQLSEKTADAKHILSLLSLGAKEGDQIRIRTQGQDEAYAAVELHRLMDRYL